MRQLAGLRLAFALFGAAVFFGWTGSAFAADRLVTNTADTGDGSLRQAIIDSNGSAGGDKIVFALPPSLSPPYSITLATPLPFITKPVSIDGTTAPGWIGPPVVELNGASLPALGNNYGLFLDAGSSGSVIRGLVIDGFSLNGIGINSDRSTIAGNYIGTDPTGGIARGNNDGIAIQTGSGNIIGGAAPADRNVISGNRGDAVYVGTGIASSNDDNVISGNYLGTNPAGTSSLGNGGRGVTLYSSKTTVTRNLISGNAPNIWILGPANGGRGSANAITGNTIGTDVTGTISFGRSGGIEITNAADNVIGGTTPADENLISGTNGYPITIEGSEATGNVVEGNTIGPDANGRDTLAGGNGGIFIFNGASNNTIGGAAAGAGNVIAYQQAEGTSAGILVSDRGGPTGGVAILGNSIFSNAHLGIDLAHDDSTTGIGLGVTPNDSVDGDAGPNGLQNFPTITSAGANSVTGSLWTTPGGGMYRIEVFASPTCDDSGYGEGSHLLGSTSLAVNSDGFTAWGVELSGGLNNGDAVTATATAPDGSTSEFSQCFIADLGGTTTTTDTTTTTGTTTTGTTTTGTTTTAAPPAPDGSGSLTTPLAPVTAGSTGNTLTFTYTAATGGMANGELKLTVPIGWSAPSTNAADAGFTKSSTGTVSVEGSLIDVAGITLSGGGTLTLTYGDKSGGGTGAKAPPTPVTEAWLAQQRSTPVGTLTSIPAPSVVVGPAASGADSLIFGTPPVGSTTPPAVAVGGTLSITGNSLRLNALPGRADIEIAIDTTSSMGASIGQAKADATALVNSVRKDIPDAQFSVVQFRDSGDTPEYQVVQSLTANVAGVQAAIDGLAPAGGNDFPEAYNLVFHNSYSPALGGDLGWRSGTRKLVVVIGDAQPHGTLSSAFTDCGDVSADPHGYSTATELAGMRTNGRTLFMMRQAATASTSLQCYQSLAAAAYPGGQGVDAGTTLGAQIVGLVQSAAAHVGTVTFATQTPGFTFTPAAAVGPLDAPITQLFDGTLTVGTDVAPGSYTVTVAAAGDSVPRATATIDVVVKPPLSSLAMSVTPSTIGAGIKSVNLASIPNAWLAFFSGSAPGTASPPLGAPPTNSTPVGSVPVGSVPVGSVPVGSIPVGSVPVGSVPVGSIPVGSIPVGSVPVGSIGLLDLPVGSIGISSLLLSQLPLCGDVKLPGTNPADCQAHGATWAQVLAGTGFANQPLNALSLADVLPNPTVRGKLAALHLNEVSFATTLLQSVRWTSLLLGPAHLLSLPVPTGFGAWCGGGNPALSAADCLAITPNTSVLQADVEGHLGSAPVGSIPVGSIDPSTVPVGSIPVGSISLAATDIAASKLAAVRIADIAGADRPSIVDCVALPDCASKTLGDAYAAGAIRPDVLFSSPKLRAAFQSAGITVNDIVAAIINSFGANGLPWETLPVQGLQPYSASPTRVTYTVSAAVDCSIARNFSLSAKLPQGFFPVPSTATGVPSTPTGLTVEGDTAAQAQTLNEYTWAMSCGTATTPITASVTFDAYVGVKLGTFPSHAEARAGGFLLSNDSDLAPVTVGQNGEPANDTADTAQSITSDTLVVGHIAVSGDQDFYNVNLAGLKRGTKVSAFLHTPTGTDLDLSISKPAAQSFFSTPVGSIPVGSIPIEDSGVGFTNPSGSLPSDTLQDVPVGSVPVGSVPVGSVPVGSISANRGDANEAAQFISDGLGGVATIAVSGYNGATSDDGYVLRVKVTPPPPVPATCPIRQVTPSAANLGALPATLPTTTKSLFIVNKQRLMAIYGKDAAGVASVNAFLGSLNTLAARPEVSGAVLQVDGSPAVASAYAAWDASPCDASLANAVVRSINDVVANYRNSINGLPNLHYIVLTGTDELTPMARTPDPVTLSPEENVAADLAFTTSGLTAGNALYNSAAENNILTDGAYGAFLSIPWLGHDLLLPQLSISRLVETPADMTGQINRYLLANGATTAGTPQTAVGMLNPQKLLTTGYDFLADGAQAVHDNLGHNFSAATQQEQIGGHVAINAPGALLPWTKDDIFTSFFQPSGAADIASLNAHYNHHEFQAADNSIGTTANPLPTTAIQARILFSMGCHGGLNVADTLGAGGAGGNYLDWPQLYAQDQVAMYLANTGFGYGDSDSVALSERLLALFAKNLRSDPGSVGEEWASALQQYFATAGAYDVYDEKVMQETTFYGLPFWHFVGAPAAPAYTPPATTTDASTGTQIASVTVTPTNLISSTFGGMTSWSDNHNSSFGLYRPVQPITSREVTAGLPARGIWVTGLVTDDRHGITPRLGYPTIDLAAHEPAPAVQPIFFPSTPFTLEHATTFGKQHDFVNVTGQFRPDTPGAKTGTERLVTSTSLQVFYSNSPDHTPPLISQVLVSGGTIQVRVSDDSGRVTKVTALVNNGTWSPVALSAGTGDPTLFTGPAGSANPEVFVEATDGVNVAYSANKGSNFTTSPAGTPAPPQIVMQAPVGPYGPGQGVTASFRCVAGSVQVTDCVGALDGRPLASGTAIDTTTFGSHTVVVKALGAQGTVLGSLQRTYVVSYMFKGFFAPVDNEPTFNTVNAGQAIPVKFSLTGNQGLDIFGAGYPKSQTIACDASAPADGIETTVSAGGSSLSYDAGSDQYNYVWKTDKAWAGTCRALLLKLKDGSMHRANFKFTK